MRDYTFTSKAKANKFYKELRNRFLLSKLEEKTVSVLFENAKIDVLEIADKLYKSIK